MGLKGQMTSFSDTDTIPPQAQMSVALYEESVERVTRLPCAGFITKRFYFRNLIPGESPDTDETIPQNFSFDYFSYFFAPRVAAARSLPRRGIGEAQASCVAKDTYILFLTKEKALILWRSREIVNCRVLKRWKKSPRPPRYLS
ncbi:hypothetical protein GDO81_026229 [Engystomops pustulosus]|uniref:Uncharacterized protein n=1 Tax=Engystomops pustulosus TaxID=76066 RepID=A0AAV6YR45_ENGPU|nr:hypothetical protein GDO81_026229 [Engystomops pustulosus]